MVAQKAQQSALADATLKVAGDLWANLFDPKDISGSWRKVEPLLVALVRQRQPISAALASNFLAAFRSSLGVTGRYVPSIISPPTADDIVPWLQAAGRSTAFNLLEAGREAEVGSLTLDSIEGSLTRLVLDGGRGTITTNVDRDPKCIGYQRQASGACCAFCAMLTGNVYASAASAGEGDDWHVKCQCSAVPVYSQNQPAPPNSDAYGALWNESTRGLSGNDARIAFRRAIEGRTI